LWRLSSSCLWFDEIFSIHAARHGWWELIKFAAADMVHPPLFYALLKIWISIGGESVFWVRLLPVLFSLATIVPFWFLCRLLNLTQWEMVLALLLMAVSRYLIGYAQEVRMYSPLLFFSVCSLWLFLRFLKSEKSSGAVLGALTAGNFLLVYTHYFGWAVIATEALLLLIWKRKHLAHFLISVAALLLLYSPWIYVVAASREQGRGLAQNLGWLQRPGLKDLKLYFVRMSEPFLFTQFPGEPVYDRLAEWAVLFLFGIPLGIFIFRTLRARPRQSRDHWLLVLAFAPVAGAFLFSWILPYPIWGNRHLLICAVPYFILAALALGRLKPEWLRYVVMLLLGSWMFLAAGLALFTRAPTYTWCSWEQLVEQMPPPESASPTPIYAFEDLVGYHLWFTGTQTQRPLAVTVIKDVPGLNEDRAFFLPRRFDEIRVLPQPNVTGEHVWLAFRSRQWNENAVPLSLVRALGYQVKQVRSTGAQGEISFLVELTRAP